jgi:hypothetical protein
MKKTKPKITEVDKIPKYIPSAHYQVHIGLSHLADWVAEELSNGLNLQPAFQRVRTWTTAQQIAYVEHFLKGGITGKDLYFNHKYWETTRLSVDANDYVIVDGRNRLQALLLFVAGKLPVFGTYLGDFDKPAVLLRRNTDLKVHVNSLSNEKDVLNWYLSLNASGLPHTEAEIKKVEFMISALNKGTKK